jgi:hypothetical protein
MRTTSTLLGAMLAICVILESTTSRAQPSGISPDRGPGLRPDAARTPSQTSVAGDSNERDDSEAFLAAGKLGGIVSFNGLGPFLAGGLELGWIFAGTGRSVTVMLDVSYATPKGDDTAPDELGRVSGAWQWEVTQKELTLQPTILYRLTGIGQVVPFAGIGPRIYLLETTSRGSVNGQEFGEHQEKSTKLGIGLPLGAEFTLGPGGLFAELLFQWAPIDHRITGESNLAAATLFVGYRALL